MADLSTAGYVAVVLALAETIKFLARPRSKSGGDNGHSGTMPVSFWREQFREIVRDVLTGEFRERNETIRRILREELDRK